jgi:hypothetical protein
MYPICCTRVFINVPWADIFKFDPNYLETGGKYKAIRSISQGRVVRRRIEIRGEW